MNFDGFCADILERAHRTSAFASSAPPKGHDDEAKTKKVLACCAIVIRDRGLQWCRDNPRKFEDAVKSKLGTAARIAIFVLGFLTGGSVWLSLLGWIIPAVIDWLTTQMQVAGAAWGIGEDVIGDQAQRFLDGLNHAT